MLDFSVMETLAQKTASKIVLVVLDGLGGIPMGDGGRGSALETARTPNIDAVLGSSDCGCTIPIDYGITPGSGPAHLALFGYDPLKYKVGRGVIEALGIDFPLGPDDLVARANFATVDEQGVVIDRRAGRISTEKNRQICAELGKIKLPGVEVMVRTVKEHRAVVVFRGPGLAMEMADTDPQKTGLKPLEPRVLRADDAGAARSLESVGGFLEQAYEILAGHKPANAVLLRGIGRMESFPRIGDVFKLTPAAVAVYPMYRGLAQLCGMNVLDAGETLAHEIACVKRHWDEYDYFFMHVKWTDSRGEDGDWEGKIKVIEEFDNHFNDLLELSPDVLALTGDHSTPAKMAAHSWHPVPFLIRAQNTVGEKFAHFEESTCRTGSLGIFPAANTMQFLMAYAGKLDKFGA